MRHRARARSFSALPFEVDEEARPQNLAHASLSASEQAEACASSQPRQSQVVEPRRNGAWTGSGRGRLGWV
eukprot:5724919-Pleurochrysis_carterae.AAC.1